MKTINSKPRMFVTSLACIPKNYDEADIETITGGLVRVRKGNYLHIPMVQLKCRSKQELIDKLTDLGDKMWEHMQNSGV